MSDITQVSGENKIEDGETPNVRLCEQAFRASLSECMLIRECSQQVISSELLNTSSCYPIHAILVSLMNFDASLELNSNVL